MKQQPVSGFQSDLHRPHLFGDISRHTLYHSFSQVRSDLRPGIRRDIDTAVHGSSHIRRYLTCRIIPVSYTHLDTIMQKAIEIQGASEIDVDFDRELKSLVQRGALLKNEGREVEKLLMNNNPDDGITGGATLWKLAQGITAFAREQEPERSRELHEISGQLMNRVKNN